MTRCILIRVMVLVLMLVLASISMQNTDGARLLGASPDLVDNVPSFSSPESKRKSVPPSGPSGCSSSSPDTSNCPPTRGD